MHVETFEKRVKPMLGELVAYIPISKTTKTEFLQRWNKTMAKLYGLEHRKSLQKWGNISCLSLMRHILQICLNFKDPGVQFYGGKNF